MADPSKNRLKNVSVTGGVADGRTFEGKMTINMLSLNDAGQLVASGILQGKVGKESVRQTFSQVVSDLSHGSSSGISIAQTATCDILFRYRTQ